MRRPRVLLGEAEAFREETGKSIGRASRGRGAERLCKDRRDNVGKGHLAAGTGDNLQRLVCQGRPEVDERDLAWRMSPWSEEGGVMPSERILKILPAG